MHFDSVVVLVNLRFETLSTEPRSSAGNSLHSQVAFILVLFTFKWCSSDSSCTSWSGRGGHTLESDNFGGGVHISITCGVILGWRSTLGLHLRWFWGRHPGQYYIWSNFEKGVHDSVTSEKRVLPWLVAPFTSLGWQLICGLSANKTHHIPSGEYPHLPQ